MKKELIYFVVAIALVLFVGYGFVAPNVPKTESTKKVEQKKEVVHSDYYNWIERDWANEYDIYAPLK